MAYLKPLIVIYSHFFSRKDLQVRVIAELLHIFKSILWATFRQTPCWDWKKITQQAM